MEVKKSNPVRAPRRRISLSPKKIPRSEQFQREEMLLHCPKAVPAFIEPMKCKLVEFLPTAGEWFYELKFDGFRALALKDGELVQLISRNRKDLSARFPDLLKSLRKLPCKQAVLDGEIVALDDRGWPSFQALQNLAALGTRRLLYYAFDLLQLNGKDITALPIEERRAALEPLTTGVSSQLRFSRWVEGSTQLLLEEVRQHGLEGLIAKRAGSAYEPGQRSGSWVKYKNLLEQEFIIGGYTPPEGTRQAFGALLVGFYEHGQLRFASKVGTGFTAALLRKLYKAMQPLRQAECPFTNLPETSAGRWGQGLTRAQMQRVTWLKPRLVCQVGFTEWTEGNHLRHPSFKGLREDKKAEEVVREKLELEAHGMGNE